jgi:hypothetical protein
MTRNEILTLCISSFSALVSMFALGWNVYRDVVIKAKIVVSIRTAYATDVGRWYVSVNAVNIGPSDVRLSAIQVRSISGGVWPFRRYKILTLIPSKELEIEGHIPVTLKQAQTYSFLYDVIVNRADAERIVNMGFRDSYGRSFWGKRRDYRDSFYSVVCG